jgi:hypothetical protein
MAFFKKPTSEEPATPPVGTEAAPAEAARPAKPINWESLVNAAETEPAKPEAGAAPEQSAATPSVKIPAVDAETKAILEQAAKDLQDKIRGNNDDSGAE